jgi:hypothetical protein
VGFVVSGRQMVNDSASSRYGSQRIFYFMAALHPSSRPSDSTKRWIDDGFRCRYVFCPVKAFSTIDPLSKFDFFKNLSSIRVMPGDFGGK